jgi:hypothetical protein
MPTHTDQEVVSAPVDEPERSSDEHLNQLLVEHCWQIADATDRTHTFIFHEPDPRLIADALGFSPIVNPKSGCHYPDEGFRPFWTVRQHEGWFQMTVSFGDAESWLTCTFVLFLRDCDRADPALRAMCQQFAAPAEQWNSGTLESSPAGSEGR